MKRSMAANDVCDRAALQGRGAAEKPLSAGGAARAGRGRCPPRRERATSASAARPTETQGREAGLDPTRYGDWEVKGIASDF